MSVTTIGRRRDLVEGNAIWGFGECPVAEWIDHVILVKFTQWGGDWRKGAGLIPKNLKSKYSIPTNWLALSHVKTWHLNHRNTTTRTGLKATAELDTRAYPNGVKVADEVLEKVNPTKALFHGEWNYTIAPYCSS